MWDKWKKKIENFIWKEVEVEDEQEFQQQELQDPVPDIKTRMVFQYPNKESYHFPRIPEQHREVNKPKVNIDIPAYQRKGSRKVKTDTVEKESITYKNNGNGSDVSKKPFERTDVPSPVYGFHSRRQRKEVESVPAYVRKHTNLEETVDVIPEEKHLPIQDFSTSIEETNIANHSAPVREFNSEQAFKKEQMEDESQSYPKIIDQDSKKVEEPSTTNSHVVTGNYSSDSIRKPMEKKQNIGPYNVLMTPEDKQKLRQHSIEKKQSNIPAQNMSIEVANSTTSIPLHLLNDREEKNSSNDQWILEQQQLLEKTLKHFNVRARVVNATQGPAVTRFEVHPELGVKVSKVKNLSDDLKLNMSAKDIRIEAPIPGKNTIGIEVPNPSSQMVSLQEIIGSDSFQSSSSPLTIALGLSIEGNPVTTNIQKMPHGLIAGATGSGKSVCINTILLSLIYKASHEDVKFLLIDPKMVELAPYNGIPHLVSPVITNVKAATAALKWAVNEMEDRYEKFVQEGVRDIERYNQKILKQNRAEEKMPFIVIVIDELADLMMVSPQDVEDAISRIAQKARACGIHLLLATQRPSVDVLTGLIKANIPTRIAFSVSSQVDSRTIIDTGGAEKLLGKGDMLFVENGVGKSMRLQGPFVSDEEIERVTNYACSIAEPNYLFEQESLLKQYVADEEEDDLLPEAIEFIFEQNSASTSLLQRQFKIGYNRAARLMDALENKGIISSQNGSKPRDVLITQSQLEEILS
ncbi:DNA translocase FtsK [Ornithinibacillus xuwenensis]|uniref:DNA translocase FtsK n=1 Tax=Ornithinibacillus xuwenensis TaxID=3144668 RepID=A0ABU9XMD0_9BACI